MTASNQHEPEIPVINEPGTQRPKTLLQRLSSGFVHALPSFRTSTPKDDLITRPTTAPIPAWKRARRGTIVAESEQLLVPQLAVTTTGQPEQPCPYNPNSYHSFASIEKRRCSFCGMRGPKIVHNEPCHACMTGGPGSHISSGRKQANSHRRHSAVDERHLAHLSDSSSSVLLGPRPVTPERAAKRIGNPPRVSRLPPGIIRLPASNTLPTKLNQKAATSSPSRLDTTSLSGRRYNVHAQNLGSSSREEPVKKPASPKLHHIHGLPNSENFPFVHKHEIPKHAIALRAGSTSPLTQRTNTPQRSPGASSAPDYSQTVYYGGKVSSFDTSGAAAPKPHVTTVLVEQVQASGSAVIDVQASPLDAALAGSVVYKNRSPQQTQPAKSSQALVDATDSETTFGSQDTTSTKLDGMRLELKGGNLFSSGTPRLRGGGGHEGPSTNTFSFKLKKWLLTCHGPCPDYFDTDSDADLPPARVVSPERVERTRQKMNGRAPLPAHLSRRVQATSPVRRHPPSIDVLPPPATFTTTISGPSKRPSSFRLFALSVPTFFYRQPESPINQPTPVVTPHSLTSPFPHLRGGAESPDKISPTLFWSAGGTGKPISFNGWKQSRPKQRMGGLFGMAVFGNKYGKAYEVEASGANGVEISCSANINITVDDAARVKSAKGSTSVTSSSSSSSSSVSSTAEPVKKVNVSAEDIASAGDDEPVQRVPTPPHHASEVNVPLCSGALPVEPIADLSEECATPSLPGDGGDIEVCDVTSGEQKKGGV